MYDVAQKHYETALVKYHDALALDTTGYAHTVISRLLSETTSYRRFLDGIHAAALQGDKATMTSLQHESNGAAGAQIDASFNQADDHVDAVAGREMSQVISAVDSLRTITLAVSLLGIVLFLLIGWRVVLSVTGPLRKVVRSLTAIAAGDRSQREDRRSSTHQLVDDAGNVSRDGNAHRIILALRGS